MCVKAAGSILGAIGAATAPVLASVGGAVLLSACASCQSTVRQTSMPLLAAAPIDSLVTDPSAHRLYLADGKYHGIDVIDISSTTPYYMRTIDVGKTPKGLAVAPDMHRLYAGLAGGAVAVIDTEESSPRFMQVIDLISAGTITADLLDYSAAKQQLLVSTGSEGKVFVVNTVTNGTVAAYALQVPVGQARFDAADGMVYVTAPTANALMRIDPAVGAVTGRFVANGCHPSGLAINPRRQLAVVACRGSIAMFNLRTGGQQVTRAVEGGDMVTYDAASDRFAVASPHDLRDSAVGVFNGDGTFIGSVAAPPNARAAAFDSAHDLVYAPGPTGLLSLAPSACMPPPEWLRFAGGLSLFVVPLLAAAVFLVLYARRHAHGAHRGNAEPSFHDLQEQDLEMERERMRAFEDAVLGPPVNQRMQPEP